MLEVVMGIIERVGRRNCSHCILAMVEVEVSGRSSSNTYNINTSRIDSISNNLLAVMLAVIV